MCLGVSGGAVLVGKGGGAEGAADVSIGVEVRGGQV